MKNLQMDPREKLPFTFLFRGPPGTGKTTTARKMGKVYYDMGFLADAEVIECSAKDLVGKYVGHTGPKAQKLIESALGKVLFIDEAYRLADGAFGKEAADELVDCITKPRFLNKLVIILAGYDHQINKLMDVNPGLSSRFAESVDFRALDPDACLELLTVLLSKETKIDMSLVTSPRPSFKSQMLDSFEELAALANFANGRDVQTICKGILRTILKAKKAAGRSLAVTEQIVLDQIGVLIDERIERAESASLGGATHTIGGALPVQTRSHAAPSLPKAATQSRGATPAAPSAAPTAGPQVQQSAATSPGATQQPPAMPPVTSSVTKDAGVSDAVWAQLQDDFRKSDAEETERLRLVQEETDLAHWLQKCADAKRQQELDDKRRRRLELERKLAREAAEKKSWRRWGCVPWGTNGSGRAAAIVVLEDRTGCLMPRSRSCVHDVAHTRAVADPVY